MTEPRFLHGYSYTVDGQSGEPEEFVQSVGAEVMTQWVESNAGMLRDEVSFDKPATDYGMKRTYEIAWDLPTMAVGERRTFRVTDRFGEIIEIYVERVED